MNDDKLPSTEVSAPAPARNLSAGEIWQGLMAMAENREIDTDRLKVLAGVQKDIVEAAHAEEDRAAKKKWDDAFARACAEMPVITKDNKIEHNGKFIGWFKKYEDLRSIVDPILRKYNLTISHDSEEIDGGKAGITVWTVIMYVDADHTWTEVRGKMPVPPDTGGAKGAGQAIGSSMTYGQRYSLCAAFGIVTKGLDNDGRTPAPQLAAPKADDLKDDAHAAAKGGSEVYEKWFVSKSRAEKVTLTTETEPHPAIDGETITVHEACKTEAKAKDQ